jgi:anthranilate phosphoribosyltransferase
MLTEKDRRFGGYITRLIRKENLSREESMDAFSAVINDETTEMQQGALLATLTAKGETAEEVAGVWEAIYELDTQKVRLNGQFPLVENSGTGMDTFKTFNISTAASILGAAGGIRMARHGARAITSVCGTVDMAEALGVDVECSADMVAGSIQKAGIGLFNGMSPNIHPRALGRILSKISFGSTLNIAASLANPAMPQFAVRGVYAKAQILPVVNVMKAIGFKRALVLYGAIDDSPLGMDEASVCGTTYCAELTTNGDIQEFTFRPSDFGLGAYAPSELSTIPDITTEARRFVALITGRETGVRTEAVLLNAGLLFYVTGKAETIAGGIELAAASLSDGSAYKTLEEWVAAQNRQPQLGLERLKSLAMSTN